jgi:hypothetical protein
MFGKKPAFLVIRMTFGLTLFGSFSAALVLHAAAAFETAPPKPDGPIPYLRKTKYPEPETELWGYADPSVRLVIPARFKAAKRFGPDGLAEVMGNGRWGMIDRQGKVAIPLEYNWAHPFQEGIARVSVSRARTRCPATARGSAPGPPEESLRCDRSKGPRGRGSPL